MLRSRQRSVQHCKTSNVKRLRKAFALRCWLCRASADVVMRRVYGALLVAMLVVCIVKLLVRDPYVVMGFVWEHADSFLRCVASPFHSFVNTLMLSVLQLLDTMWLMRATAGVDFDVHATAYEFEFTRKFRGGPCAGPPSPCARNAPHAASAHSTQASRPVRTPFSV